MRMHVVSAGMGSAIRVVDLDDLGDRLLLLTARDRTSQRGYVRSLCHNVHSIIDAARWRRLQRRTARSVDAICVCSEDDRAYLGAPNCVVIPNGYPEPAIDTDCAKAPEVVGPSVLLFVGPLTYEPNLLAVEWMAHEVLPHLRTLEPDARLVVVGEIGRAAARVRHLSDVVFTGRVPDIAPYYAGADAAVTPLRSGGGTRLKVIEALARSVPLVSTSFACAGLGLVPGRHALVADDGLSFAKACSRVLSDSGLAQRLTAAGRTHYEELLTAARSSQAVSALVSDLIATGRSATVRPRPPRGTSSPPPLDKSSLWPDSRTTVDDSSGVIRSAGRSVPTPTLTVGSRGAPGRRLLPT
jgi:glycosyltransferase involved in cell wall biosynthesis